MNHRQRMLAGLPYQAGLDGLPQERLEARKLTYAFNHLPPEQQEEVAQDIEASMAKIFEPEAEAPASSADLGDTRAFDQIQFGKDYEIE